MANPKSVILKSLYFSKSQSIAEMSERIGKSIPSTTKAVNELMEENLIKGCGLRASTGGRRAMTYRLNPEKHGYLIAMAIDQYFTSITTYSITNNQITPIEVIPTDLKEDVKAYQQIEKLLEKTLDALGELPVLAIGITVPGFVDSKSGVNNSFTADSPMYSIRKKIASRFGIQTYIENDSSAIAIAEKNFGLGQDANNTLIINLNWGVGLGMIIQNQLFRGHTGFAGEFSHIPLANENKLCSCGKKGCLEVEASLLCAMEYIIQDIQQGERSYLESIFQKKQNITLEDVYEAYQNGDQVTIRALKKIAHMLGKGIATLIHILNPEKIIVSGRGASFGEVLLPQIQSSIQEFCIPRLSKYTQIQISEIQNVQLLASACIAIQQMHWTTHEKNTTKFVKL